MRIAKMTAAVIALTMIAALVLCPFAAYADMTYQSRPVKVGFFEMQGYHMIGKNGARSGYGYDFLQLVARYSNIRFEYVGYDKSWDEMLKMLESGEIDLLTSAQKTPEREERFDFTSSLIGTSAAMLTVKAGDDRYSDGNYANMRIGLIRDNSRNKQLDDLMNARGFSYTPVYYHGMNDLTEALQDGSDIDAAMTSNLRWTKNEWTLEEINSSPFYAMVKKGDSELLSKINDAINLMDTNSAGWRTRLFNKYYSMDSGDVVAFTADEREYIDAFIKSGRVLSVTMNPDCAPYSYFKNGRAMGVIPDIFAEVASRMGIEYEIVEPESREDYFDMCVSDDIDMILDGIDDYYTIETNGLEVTDPYYTTPLAALTTKVGVDSVESLSLPKTSLLNESKYLDMFDGKTVVDKDHLTLAETAQCVKNGGADGTYMCYYSAQWLSNADQTGKIRSLMLPQYDRAFVYAVRSGEDFRLLSSLNKALKSLSSDYISSVVARDTEYPDSGFSLIGFVYQNPIAAIAIIAAVIFVVIACLFLIDKNRRAARELKRAKLIERYIGYLCDIHYRVLEIDLDLKTRKQYVKKNGAIEISERSDFTGISFDQIHPDDREKCFSVFSNDAIRALAQSGKDERYAECRMTADDGSYRWFGITLKLVPKDDEHPQSAIILIKDVEDIHRERDSNHELLVAALDAANAASRSKSAFLSSMSHEIRTPLNAVIGYMTVASASVNNREKLSHCIESAGIAAKHLLSIINDVLDISSMESGKIKLAKDPFDLKELLSNITSVFYQQCRQKGIQFAISLNSLTEEWVVGDPLRVNQILMNLMSNAVKFTDVGGSVSLAVVQTSLGEGQVYIRFIVKDTGIGMSEEYMSRLFSPFEQESAQTARKYGGTGLGMSITFNLVSLMGGKIDVSSKQGEGSTFTVTLPFGHTENARVKNTSGDFSALNVLIVDDMENECDYVHALLNRLGVNSQSARSGEEAIRLVASRKDTPDRFDLCIIDWNMPGLNGVETTRLIHKQCDPDIPIIIATAYDISEFEDAALDAGAARIISKPLFQSTLFDLLMTTYGNRETFAKADDDIPDLNGMKVLLAEDNEMNVEVAIDILELAGIKTSVARNGREAVDMFLSDGDGFDAILMDVQMPVMDGYEATRAIRDSGRPKAKTIPIIAMTANAFAEDVSASLASGMNGHLSKPIETRELFNTLRRVERGTT